MAKLKFRYRSVDGVNKIVWYTEAEAREELKYHDLGASYAASFDGVSTLTPANGPARALFHELLSPEPPPPDDEPHEPDDGDWYADEDNGAWYAERACGGDAYGGMMDAEAALYDRLEREAPEAFSNGDGTGQVNLRLLPSGW